MCVWVCVCLCVCIYVRVYLCMYVHVCMFTYVQSAECSILWAYWSVKMSAARVGTKLHLQATITFTTHLQAATLQDNNRKMTIYGNWKNGKFNMANVHPLCWNILSQLGSPFMHTPFIVSFDLWCWCLWITWMDLIYEFYEICDSCMSTKIL